MAQELLGQSEYNIAVDYVVGREGIPVDQAMWARFCARAAAYNIDLAQKFLAEGTLANTVLSPSPMEAYAWTVLASDKQTSERATARAMQAAMSTDARGDALARYEDLVQTRERDGAYYRIGDPLREPTAEALAAMPQDDPDVEVRRAFALEAAHQPGTYEEALGLYRKVWDTSWMAAMAVLGRKYMTGADGVQANPVLAWRWLERSVAEGYKPAALLLASWYEGQGGGTLNAVQARSWRLIAGDPQAAGVQPRTADEEAAAAKLYEAWIATHPGWATKAP